MSPGMALPSALLLTPLPTHPPRQDITACESEATKKGVQVGTAQKQLEKLGKEGAKSQAEKEKMEAQREATMQVRLSGLLRSGPAAVSRLLF